MPLNASYAEIPDWKNVCYNEDGSLSAITEVLVMKTMMVDIGHVTPTNLDEFVFRVLMIEKVFGGSIVEWRGEPAKPVERSLTIDEIRSHVGLRTNVYTEKSRAKWLTSFKRMVVEHFSREVQWAMRKGATSVAS